MPDIIVFKDPKKVKAKCEGCGREMERPREERPPYWCWKCKDKMFEGMPADGYYDG